MKWAYRGRTSYEFWSALYPECGGSRQSPINIDTSLVTSRDDIPRLHLHHYRQVTEANTILSPNRLQILLSLVPDLTGAGSLRLLHLPRLPDHPALLGVCHLDCV